MKEYGQKSSNVKGMIYLFKNDKLIRDKAFNRKYGRVQLLNEYMEIAKIHTGDTYYITIKLDI